jgi:L-serine dehydratase
MTLRTRGEAPAYLSPPTAYLSGMVSLLDIIGPVMVGPSSSHTAGACRIGLIARGMVGGTPQKAKVELHGSFARTGVGHGTDRAIAGGLMGFTPDDERLRQSLELAEQGGLAIEFTNTKLRGDHHPNTTRITVTRDGTSATIIGSSLGAGRILITEIDGYPVEITGSYPVLVLVAHDEPGIVASVSSALASEQNNISTMRVSRRQKGGDAIHIYELDAPASAGALDRIRALKAVKMIRSIDRVA